MVHRGRSQPQPARGNPVLKGPSLGFEAFVIGNLRNQEVRFSPCYAGLRYATVQYIKPLEAIRPQTTVLCLHLQQFQDE